MDVYSIALAAAIAALVLESAGVLLSRRRLVRVATAAALVFLGVSIVSHVFSGHRPGTERSLGFVGFVVEHEAFWVVAILVIGLWSWSRRGGRS